MQTLCVGMGGRQINVFCAPWGVCCWQHSDGLFHAATALQILIWIAPPRWFWVNTVFLSGM